MLDFNCRDNRKVFGKRLQEARKMAGFQSQQAFSDALEVERATVSEWESGGNFPTLANLSKICNITRVDLGFLCGEYTEKNETVHVVCAETGLSEKAYNRLLELQKSNQAQIRKWALGSTELEHLLLSDELPEILRLYDLFRARCVEALSQECRIKYENDVEEKRRTNAQLIKAREDMQLFLFNIQQLLFRRAENIESEMKRAIKQKQKQFFEYSKKEGASNVAK